MVKHSLSAVSRWSSHDLDRILNEGDQLYKSLNTQNYLDLDDLQTTIETFSGRSTAVLRETIECEVNLVQDFPFLAALNGLTNPGSNSSTCLISIGFLVYLVFHFQKVLIMRTQCRTLTLLVQNTFERSIDFQKLVNPFEC